MKPFRWSAGLVALGLITMAASPVEAAWNNVFQVTCWHCGGRASSSSYYLAPAPAYSSYYSYYSAPVVANYYAAPVVASYYAAPVVSYSAPCGGCGDPCQTCTTRYVQRCYYQPVTTYTTQSYYEAVTSYTTRTYYEPVTTYRYSSYYDPCSCGCQQVAVPVTAYVARQQCCPVQSWVQRCCQVPVTGYQKSFYWEPQTSCCAAPAPCATCGAPVGQVPAVVGPAPAGPPPAVQAMPVPTTPPPAVDGRQTPPPPTADGKSGSPLYDQYYKDVPQSQYRQLAPNGQYQAPAKASPVMPPPSVKLERITMSDGSRVNGQIVSGQNSPKAGVQLIFVSAKRTAPEKTATANAAGRFAVDLTPGNWLVYMRARDGQQVYHSQIEIAANQQTPIVLVSR